jgi:hypothetical protein
MKIKLLELINKLNIKFELEKFVKVDKRKHTYHMVDRSPYPFRLAFITMFMMIGFVFYINSLFLGG